MDTTRCSHRWWYTGGAVSTRKKHQEWARRYPPVPHPTSTHSNNKYLAPGMTHGGGGQGFGAGTWYLLGIN